MTRDIHIHIGGRDDDRFNDEPTPEDGEGGVAVAEEQDPGTIKVTRARTTRYDPFDEQELPAGLNIAQVKERLWDTFGMNEGLVALVEGKPVGDGYVTKDKDWVHFNAAPKERGL
jgi:hypothetical protein